ncbi:MAG: Bax inhibitor-1/YccA family protein, partial [Candidatus Microthrix subdominans]
MANPMLNDKSLEKASTWGPGSAASADTMTQWPPPGMERPVGLDGESRGMTMRGTAWATSVLMALLLLSAAFGWVQTASPTTGFNAAGQQVTNFTIPMLAWVGVGVGVVCLIGLWFRPRMAKFIAPVYALAQGFFVGAISKMYESFQGGIVVQAIGATLAVFLVMLFL